MASQTISTLCGVCHVNCGLDVTVSGGEVREIRGTRNHPANRGALCIKGYAAREILHSPRRLTRPLMKQGDRQVPVSWEQALGAIAERLQSICAKWGPQSLVHLRGAPVTEEVREGFLRLACTLGTPNFAGSSHLCSLPRDTGLRSLMGMRPDPDYTHTRCMVLWGTNPSASMRLAQRTANGGFDGVLFQKQKEGIRLLVVDPIRTPVAEKADLWLRPKLGTDLALALGMIHEIITEELYDQEFVSRWTVGFEGLCSHVEPRSPEWAEKITGVPAEEIRSAARLYASTKPALIRDGNGLDMYPNVVQTVRAVGMLSALTGNVDVPGGDVDFPLPPTAPSPKPKSAPPAMHRERHPIFPALPVPILVDALLTGKPYLPRAMLVYHNNPVLINAEEARVRRALERLELLVVSDVVETATTRLAHFVLPDLSFLERLSFHAYSHPDGGFVALRQPVAAPVGESRSAFEVEYELARKMGLDQDYPWRDSESWVNYKLGPSHVSAEDLRREPIRVVTGPAVYRKYETKGFNTPSGKIEFFSERFRSHSYPPYPVYRDFTDYSDGSRKSQFPLLGTTRKPMEYVHTKWRDLPTLKKLYPEPVLTLSPEDAAARGIRKGDRVSVVSPRAGATFVAEVDTSVPAGVVQIDFGWGNPGDEGCNVNALSSNEYRDPISGTTPNRLFRCEISRLS